MIASLYQSGSPAIGAAAGAGRACSALIAAGSSLQWRDGEDTEGSFRRQVDGDLRTALGAPAAGQQVGHSIPILPADADRRKVRMQDPALYRARVNVDGHVDRVAPAVRVAGQRVQLAGRKRLPIEEGPGPRGVLEAQVLVGLQRRSRAAQPVEGGDQRLDVAGRIPIPDPDLVFLAVLVLLPLPMPLRLAQLEARVDAPAGRQGRREDGANLECRTAVVEVEG